MSADQIIALFPTCLVDLYRPSVGFAVIKLLEQAGYRVVVPQDLTCCGQPAYNSGDRKTTKKLALKTLQSLKDFDYIVVPSGSCAGMVIKHYPALFEQENEHHLLAKKVAQKTFELTQFLEQKTNIDLTQTPFKAHITYHDSCSGYRELNISEQPRKLLSQLKHVKLEAMEDSFVCCGFGGTFCIKYPDISNAMLGDKISNIESTQAEMLTGGDLGCLMNIAGKMQREKGKDAIKVRHIAEILAGDDTTPPIGLSNHPKAEK